MPKHDTVIEQLIALMLLALMMLAKGAYVVSLWLFEEIRAYAMQDRNRNIEGRDS